MANVDEFRNAAGNWDHWIFYLAYLLELLAVPALVYLTLCRSQQLRRYRFYLLNNALWNFAIDTLALLVHPNFVFPVPCTVFNGFYRPHGVEMKFCLVLLIFLLLGMDFAVIFSMFYRYAQVRRVVGSLQRSSTIPQ